MTLKSLRNQPKLANGAHMERALQAGAFEDLLFTRLDTP